MLASCTVFAFDGRAFLERMIAGRLSLAREAHVRLLSLYQACRPAASRLLLVRLCRMRLRRPYVLSTSSMAGSRPARQYPHRGVRRHRAHGVSRGATVQVQVRDLRHGHEGFPRVHAWPPVWMPGGHVTKGEFGAEGVLVSVKRLEDHLALRMRYEGRAYRPAPMGPASSPYRSGADLTANVGKVIQDLGELDV